MQEHKHAAKPVQLQVAVRSAARTGVRVSINATIYTIKIFNRLSKPVTKRERKNTLHPPRVMRLKAR